MFICDWSRSSRLTMVTSARRGTLTIDVDLGIDLDANIYGVVDVMIH